MKEGFFIKNKVLLKIRLQTMCCINKGRAGIGWKRLKWADRSWNILEFDRICRNSLAYAGTGKNNLAYTRKAGIE